MLKAPSSGPSLSLFRIGRELSLAIRFQTFLHVLKHGLHIDGNRLHLRSGKRLAGAIKIGDEGFGWPPAGDVRVYPVNRPSLRDPIGGDEPEFSTHSITVERFNCSSSVLA
jgi:hypothetical protein